MLARGSRIAWLDRAGTFVAALCALHCALVPLALAVVPSLTLALLSWKDPRHRAAMLLLEASRWEWLIVAIALAMASASLGAGLYRHGDLRPLRRLAAAALLFGLAIASPLSADPYLHALFAVCGGLALAAAHLRNLRLLHGLRDAAAAPAHAARPPRVRVRPSR